MDRRWRRILTASTSVRRFDAWSHAYEACATFGERYGINNMQKAAFLAAILFCATMAQATPANKAALDRHFDRFLAKNLNACTTCHLPSDKKDPQNLDEF